MRTTGSSLLTAVLFLASVAQSQRATYQDIPWCSPRASVIKSLRFNASGARLQQGWTTSEPPSQNEQEYVIVKRGPQSKADGSTVVQEYRTIAAFGPCGLVRVDNVSKGLPPFDNLELAFTVGKLMYGTPDSRISRVPPGYEHQERDALLPLVAQGDAEIGWKWSNGYSIFLNRDLAVQQVWEWKPSP